MIKSKLFSYALISLLFLIFSTISVRGDWTQYQFSQNSSGFFPITNPFDSTTIINLTNSNNGSNFQPLVGDLNGDDVNEVVVFGINNVFVYNTYLNLKTQYNLGGNILGQPALFNVSGNKGLELVLSLNVSDVNYFIMYNYSNAFTPISNITISNNLSGSGIKCTSLNSTKSCIFMDNVFSIHVVNLSNANNPVDNATQVSNSPNRANTTNYETIPAIADFDNDGNKEALFWNDNDAGDRFGFVVFDLLDKTKDAAPSAGTFLPYLSNEKIGQPIFVKSNFSLTYIAFASNTATTGQIRAFNGTGTNLANKGAWPQSLISPDLALVSGTLLAIDCDSDGLEDIAGMAYGGAATRSRLFCYNGDRTQIYSINSIDSLNIIETTATAVNISGNSTPEIVTYKGVYSFDGTLKYGFVGLGTQAPIPVDVNNDGKLDFLWTNSTNGVALFTSTDSLAPTSSNLNKSPEPSFKNQIVYINVTWQDPAGVDAVLIAHNGTENWVNYSADNSFGNNIYNFTIPANNSNYSLKVIGWYSTANDTAGNRNTTSIQTFLVNNRAPNATNVLLNNTDFLNRTNGSLIVSWQFSDPDNDAQAGNETLWYINGTENTGFKNLTIINASNTTKTQNWTFSVSVSDGTNFSAFVNSTSLIIQNSVPTHTIPVINSSDEQSRKNGTLTCNNQSTSDLDNDAVANFIRWYKNNALVETAINLTNLSVGNYSKNDNVTCEVTPNDGAVNGTSLNSTNFTILNAASLLNNSVQNKTWDEDSSATISMVNGFVDIDGDNLTYNFTPVSNIVISINNNTGIATLTPDADFNGVNNILFFAFDGTSLTSSNNVTLTISDVAEPSTPSSPSSGGGGGGGGGGLPGYVCDSEWECGGWGECTNGKQARECKLVKVPVFISEEKCPQDKSPEQSRNCAVPAISAKKESCDDKIKNQNEEGVDCGGPCAPCFNLETKKEEKGEEKKETNQAIFGPAVVAQPSGFSINDIKLWHVILIVFLISTILIVKYKFLRKKIKK
ncbi:MAG: cadherin-like domain-containing protein [Nanoarchaeota archaeon]|nr:cadherin-like domain-containing protein [Nanoarchaeota archaeon]